VTEEPPAKAVAKAAADLIREDAKVTDDSKPAASGDAHQAANKAALRKARGKK